MSEIPDPRKFFTERMPAQFNRALADQIRSAEMEQRVLDGMRAVKATLCFAVRGDGGGTFYTNIEEGRSRSGDTPTQPPFLTLALDAADFEALFTEAGDNVLGFLGGVTGMATEMKLTQARLDLISGVRGTLLFELTGPGGFKLFAHLGPESPGEPATTIRIETDAYRELRDGKTEPQQAFLDGKIQVEGDMQLAMSLALAVLSPD